LVERSKQGDGEALLYLGLRYYQGVGVEQDSERAFARFVEAAEAGSARARFLAAIMRWNGDGVAQDLRQAEQWMQAAVDQGLAEARYSLGIVRLVAGGDPEAAVQLLQEEAAAGDVKACASLGVLYLGIGPLPTDFDAAAKHLTAAARLGHAGSQRNLAGLLFGAGDYELALRYFRSAALHGDPAAQTGLGFMLHRGLGTLRDPTRGLTWFREAASNGHPDAMALIGWAYRRGEGVTQDHVQAVQWFRRASELGHGGAQVRLAHALATGTGVAADEQEALAWLGHAAAQGDAWALQGMARLETDPAAIRSPEFWSTVERSQILSLDASVETELTISIALRQARPEMSVEELADFRELEAARLGEGEPYRLMRIAPEIHVLLFESVSRMHESLGRDLAGMVAAVISSPELARLFNSFDGADVDAPFDRENLACYLVDSGFLQRDADGGLATAAPGVLILWTQDALDPSFRRLAFKHELQHALVELDPALQAAIQAWFRNLPPALQEVYVPVFVGLSTGIEDLEPSRVVYEGAAYLRDPRTVVENIRLLRVVHELKQRSGLLTDEDRGTGDLLARLFEQDESGAVTTTLRDEVVGSLMLMALQLQTLEAAFLRRHLGHRWADTLLQDPVEILSSLVPDASDAKVKEYFRTLVEARQDNPVKRDALALRLDEIVKAVGLIDGSRTAGPTEQSTSVEFVKLIREAFDLIATTTGMPLPADARGFGPIREAVVDGLLHACVEQGDRILGAAKEN
jgi:hypothetical protein